MHTGSGHPDAPPAISVQAAASPAARLLPGISQATQGHLADGRAGRSWQPDPCGEGCEGGHLAPFLGPEPWKQGHQSWAGKLEVLPMCSHISMSPLTETYTPHSPHRAPALSWAEAHTHGERGEHGTLAGGEQGPLPMLVLYRRVSSQHGQDSEGQRPGRSGPHKRHERQTYRENAGRCRGQSLAGTQGLWALRPGLPSPAQGCPCLREVTAQWEVQTDLGQCGQSAQPPGTPGEDTQRDIAGREEQVAGAPLSAPVLLTSGGGSSWAVQVDGPPEQGLLHGGSPSTPSPLGSLPVAPCAS